MSSVDPKDIPLSEVLEGALEYMKETETAARRKVGYPSDLERCIRFQIEAFSTTHPRDRIEQLDADLARLTKERDEALAEVARLKKDALSDFHFAAVACGCEPMSVADGIKRVAEQRDHAVAMLRNRSDLADAIGSAQRYHHKQCSRIYEAAKKAGLCDGLGACGNGGVPTFGAIVDRVLQAIERARPAQAPALSDRLRHSIKEPIAAALASITKERDDLLRQQKEGTWYEDREYERCENLLLEAGAPGSMDNYSVSSLHDKLAFIIKERDEALAKGKAFKDFVHGRLDAMGIPTHPDGPHSKEGCRVGDRLDLLQAQRDAAMAGRLRADLALLAKELDVAALSQWRRYAETLRAELPDGNLLKATAKPDPFGSTEARPAQVTEAMIKTAREAYAKASRDDQLPFYDYMRAALEAVMGVKP